MLRGKSHHDESIKLFYRSHILAIVNWSGNYVCETLVFMVANSNLLKNIKMLLFIIFAMLGLNMQPAY